jgi:hypothetical protein
MWGDFPIKLDILSSVIFCFTGSVRFYADRVSLPVKTHPVLSVGTRTRTLGNPIEVIETRSPHAGRPCVLLFNMSGSHTPGL